MDIREASHVIESDLVITPIFEGELLNKSFDKLKLLEEIIKSEVARDEEGLTIYPRIYLLMKK
jgi:hypothetical protein